MKSHTLTLTMLLMASVTLSQNGWNKDERNNLYSDCMSYSTKYKNVTPEQKESICLCYLEEATKKYEKKDFEAKIDIEVKRIKDAMIAQCSKNIGIDLSTQITEKKEEVVEVKSELIKNKPTQAALLGIWRTDQGETIEFRENGKYAETSVKGKTYLGEWFLDEEGTLTIITENHKTQLITKKEKVERVTYIFDFVSFSKSFMKLSDRKNAGQLQANKVK